MSKNLIKKSEIISVTQFRRPILILRRAHVPKATSCKKIRIDRTLKIAH